MNGSQQVDVLVIGGGINGAGIARDAAGRGLKVLLVEQGDLASATSSASTKLIHGGLRYLEYGEFRLVREALIERERLLSLAPHIIWPLRFVLPHPPGLRPAWMIRLGLFLYDHLGGRQRLPGSHAVDLTRDPRGAGLDPSIKRGYVYSDCWVEDARLVVLNARDAAERGAEIRTRTRFVSAERQGDHWVATIEDLADGSRRRVEAPILVNAAGPWVGDVLRQRLGNPNGKAPRLVKGSHIIVPRLFEGEQAYILQNPDKRIVFAIPYEGRFTLVGTTDVPYKADPAAVAIDRDETAYLAETVSRYFKTKVTPADVVWSYSGVRPLYDDAASNASAVTRDYVLDVEGAKGEPVLLSIFGGKITTFRRLAEHALQKLEPFLPRPTQPWTATAPLPGGDLPGDDFDAFLKQLQQTKPWLPAPLARRLARAYGSRVDRILAGATDLAGLGHDFGGGLTEAEVVYLRDQEWARSADDVLWRRSKLGLHVPPGTREALDRFFLGSAGADMRQERSNLAL
ncbi:glycerol-3-phosphate dehydrogenase [Aliidongia dinghuensis]|uniref:Glycerol-3-phosphate dehydrogenase n=1 Tax=Aliidongia dinghuensis TaxID=1867774 RepID=A0A8J3E5B1_9PROT|nr:glycerol-3-phosphate dehydrogenase [Aliidongia dinghuensis]GGF34358.1 glycerol-3-phosphate dehydrogenase [Aliidongia dinghuensis]